MKRIAPALAWLLLCTPAFAAQWTRVPGPTDGNAYYFDRSNLVIQDQIITYWKKVVFGTPQRLKQGIARSGLYRERIDCGSHTLALLNYLLYAADGRLIDDGAMTQGAAPIIPDTIGDAFEARLCTLAKAPHAQDPSVREALAAARRAEAAAQRAQAAAGQAEEAALEILGVKKRAQARKQPSPGSRPKPQVPPLPVKEPASGRLAIPKAPPMPPGAGTRGPVAAPAPATPPLAGKKRNPIQP
ncbi:MAG: hypothetical protein M0037_01040 [Betaproteobacteria bacterium]|nr:hypothetical protein [Betaproteobacteria bacterium]